MRREGQRKQGEKRATEKGLAPEGDTSLKSKEATWCREDMPGPVPVLSITFQVQLSDQWVLGQKEYAGHILWSLPSRLLSLLLNILS